MRLAWQIAFFAALMLGMAAIWFKPRAQYNMSTTIVPPAEYYEDWQALVGAEWDI